MKQSAANVSRYDDSATSSHFDVRVAIVADLLRCDRKSKQTVRIRVTGESMLPTLWPGDEVEIASCSLEDVTPGDIVLAERGGKLFLHRLVRTREDGFVLRGDSVPKDDPEFTKTALLGRLKSIRGIPFPSPAFWNQRFSLGILPKSLRLNDSRIRYFRNSELETKQLGRRMRLQTIALIWTRAVGTLLCYCGPMRRLALRWHQRGVQAESSGPSLETV